LFSWLSTFTQTARLASLDAAAAGYTLSTNGDQRYVDLLTGREQDVLHLLAQGKSNRELAEALVLSLNTVKWYARQVYAKLGVANREDAVARARELGLLAEAAPALQHTLPAAATPLIGRERELAEVQELLDGDARLISLVGPGGIGKTHLALEAARKHAGFFTDGAAFANLAPLRSAEGIVPALAQVLRFKPAGGAGERRDARQQLLDYLRDKALLLVLDNFEHLQAGAALLSDILAAAPQVTLLVTSRERLMLRVEHVYALQGLAFSDWQTVEEAQEAPAVRLFVHYGRRVRPGFALRAEELEALQQLVQLVAGMPLALILASAWLELLSPSEIASEIARNLDFLAADYRDMPARQRSVRAVFETTWARLEEREQQLFAALSVFRGGFTLEAAREVAGSSLRDLLGLVNRSLLARGEEGRFEVHELLGQFSAEELARSPVAVEAIRDRHSDYYLAFLEEHEPLLKGMGAEAALKALALDIDNIHAAWDWAVTRQKFALLGAGAFSLAEFSRATGRYGEGLAAFSRAIEPLRRRVSQMAPAGPADLSALVILLIWQCRLQIPVGAFDKAIALCNEALSLLERPELEETDTQRERALALLQVAPAYFLQDRSVEAEQLVNESISLLGAAGPSLEMATAFEWLGGIGLRLAYLDQAGDYFRQAMEMYGALGDHRNKAKMQFWLGYALHPLGTWDGAEQAMWEGITAVRDLDQEFAAMQMTLFAEALIHRGKFEQGQATTVESMKQHKALGERNWFAMSVRVWCEAALHLGNYEDVLDQIPMVLETSRADGISMSLGMSQVLFGCAYLAQGQLDSARGQLEEGAHTLRQIASRDYLCLALPALACTCTIEGELSQASKAILETTKTALELGAALFLAPGLAAAALLLRAKGEVERAVELYALACREPYVANSRWYDDLVGHELHAAAASLPPGIADAAQQRGQQLDMWQTAAQLLVELEVTVTSEE
jgi:predicted ATPase/DNA-binding CsgD family transcriptional regulator